MRREKPWTKIISSIFSHKPVCELGELAKVFGVSKRMVLRYLKWVGYYTSYNFNSRYYTLEGIPQFDEDGLWGYEGIWFSIYKTLRGAVIQEIDKSEAGMTTSELRTKLHTRVTNHMAGFVRDGVVVAKRHGHLHVYYSSQEPRRAVQMSIRGKALKETWEGEAKEKLLSSRQSALQVIDVLVTKIAYPDWGVEEIFNDLYRRGVEIKAETVEASFEHFKLSKKNSKQGI